MKHLICSIIFLSNLVGCASNPGLRILEERSDYLNDLKVLDLGYGTAASLPVRRGELALVWRHETQLPNGDYFWGGWVSIAVSRQSLVIEKNKQVQGK